MEAHGLTPPTAPTLRRYGMTLEDWVAIVARQRWRCPVCDRHLSRVRTNIDHEHVLGWKGMTPEMRARFVRGVLCARCNWKVVPDPTPPASHIARLAVYLAEHEKRYAAASIRA